MNKLEILRQKLVMYYIKKIIINELNNSYYDDNKNISKIFDLGSKCEYLSATDVTYHINNLIYYKNGFIKYNNYIEAAASFPDEFINKDIIDSILKRGR